MRPNYEGGSRPVRQTLAEAAAAFARDAEAYAVLTANYRCSSAAEERYDAVRSSAARSSTRQPENHALPPAASRRRIDRIRARGDRISGRRRRHTSRKSITHVASIRGPDLPRQVALRRAGFNAAGPERRPALLSHPEVRAARRRRMPGVADKVLRLRPAGQW